ncbi:interferon inducible double stranded rna-dependen t protein kinase activator a [Trichuris trichiura]|uniref:Interferon inducible double stranded rna-dependen t protein kinase activator a n=1 Tax=Trichuris trichiura TaxID=36087 RepID=A0A077YWP3_TRITR|nr:interferon inducible double stranded rna-dependen t protein kinase activator a [Trichuris trichiura]
MAKNPIMALYEKSVKEHFPLKLELAWSGGPPHAPTFCFRATAKGITAEGTGTSKQMAKTVAADNLLRLLQNSPGQSYCENAAQSLSRFQNQDSPIGEPTSAQNVTYANLGAKFDSISALQLACAKNDWCLPKYSEVPQNGSLDFCMQVSIKNFSSIGRGTTKQEAKHNAAFMLLKAVKSLSPNERKEKLARFETTGANSGQLQIDRTKVLAKFFPAHLQFIPEEEVKVLENLMAQSLSPCSKHLEFLEILSHRLDCKCNFVPLGKTHEGM